MRPGRWLPHCYAVIFDETHGIIEGDRKHAGHSEPEAFESLQCLDVCRRTLIDWLGRGLGPEPHYICQSFTRAGEHLQIPTLSVEL